jgi:hypothetical protein
MTGMTGPTRVVSASWLKLEVQVFSTGATPLAQPDFRRRWGQVFTTWGGAGGRWGQVFKFEREGVLHIVRRGFTHSETRCLLKTCPRNRGTRDSLDRSECWTSPLHGIHSKTIAPEAGRLPEAFMVRRIVFVATAVCILLTSTTALADAALTNKDVISLSALGIGEVAVIAKIRQAAAVAFALDVADLAALKKAGVSGSVIAAMLDREAADSALSPASSPTLSGQEPEYVGTFCLRNPTTGGLTPLERQSGTSAISVTAMGFGGGESYIRVNGERSSLRLQEGSEAEFVVLAESQNTDPQQFAQLFALDVIDGERRLPMTRVASMGLGARSVANNNQMALVATRFGKSSFLIKPSEPLGPGEYAFVGPVTGVGFCFGIDEHAGTGRSRFERTVPFKQRESLALDISDRGMTVHSVEVIQWPGEGGHSRLGSGTMSRMRKVVSREDDGEPRGEIVVVFKQSNRSGRDYKCAFDVLLLDEAGAELGSGKRTVGIEDGEIGDTARVGVSIALADLPRVMKLRIRAVPKPDI